MSAFTVIPKDMDRHLAVMSWPGNEEKIENIFGSRVQRTEDPDFYDWLLLSESGYEAEPVQQGNWIVLSPDNSIKVYSHDDFTSEFTILETAFELHDPTGSKEQQ